MSEEKEIGAQQNQVAVEPKKSKRKLYGLIALAVAVLIYILVPSGEPSGEAIDEAATNENIISQANLGTGKVTIESYDSKKRVFGKWVISGIISNTSDQVIESIEFKAGFSDNTEYIMYDEKIEAGEKDHEFTIKVTGHKGESLDFLKIGEMK
ncbi:MAG: hypothetical protein AB8B72_04595 [Crocinitomicaceae bacterium]